MNYKPNSSNFLSILDTFRMVNNIIVYHSTRSSYSTEVAESEAESESEDNKEITGSALVAAEDLFPEAAEAEAWFSASLYPFNFSVADTKHPWNLRKRWCSFLCNNQIFLSKASIFIGGECPRIFLTAEAKAQAYMGYQRIHVNILVTDV